MLPYTVRNTASYNTLQATPVCLTLERFRLFPFRSPLLRESQALDLNLQLKTQKQLLNSKFKKLSAKLFYLPRATEMFHFARLPILTKLEQHDIIVLGCPIRKSPDQRLLGAFPKLIAAFHVLHRLHVPRYPPYALKYGIKFATFKALTA